MILTDFIPNFIEHSKSEGYSFLIAVDQFNEPQKASMGRQALIATAAGLAAAIPAVIFYNYYLNKIKNISTEMDNFASEVLNIIDRYYVKK